MTRHIDCRLEYLVPSNRYKALVYVDGYVVKVLYDFSVFGLRQQLRPILLGLDAESNLSQSKHLQWALQQTPCGGAAPVIQIQGPARKKLVFDSPKQNFETSLSV